MSHPLYDASVPVFSSFLSGLPRLMDKALAAGVEEAALMEARLAPDMFAFPPQVQIATDMAKLAVARLTGREPPSWPDTEATVEELKARVETALAYLEATPPEAFEGAEARTVEMKASGVPLKFVGAEFLHRFCAPNFYFHMATAYGLVRAQGVSLSKRDYFGVA